MSFCSEDSVECLTLNVVVELQSNKVSFEAETCGVKVYISNYK